MFHKIPKFFSDYLVYTELNKEKIALFLNGKLPGGRSQEKMKPEDRIQPLTGNDFREAAVLLLLYPDMENIRLVFMKRNEYDGPHSGQISFPGGMKEESDEDYVRTALRETEEEIGVPSISIDILGALSKILIPVSNFCVYPFVGWINEVPSFSPDESEVQYLICPTLSSLCNPENKKTGHFLRKGKPVLTPYFDTESEIIWGATAMILSEFIDLLDCWQANHH